MRQETPTMAQHRRLFLLTPLMFLVASCAGTSEASVAPGINDPYRSPRLSEWVARFEGESREIYQYRHRVVQACALEPGQRVADVGAGTGLFIPLLAEQVGDGGRVFAVDIVPEFVDHVRTKARERGLHHVEAVLCTERSVELPANSVDVVFCCDTYHHFEYPRSTLASIHRALAPGGRFVVVDFERIEGVSRPWILGHVRAGKDIVRAEVESAGFTFLKEVKVEGLVENYMLHFGKR